MTAELRNCARDITTLLFWGIMTPARFLRLAMGVGAINIAERAIGIVLGIVLARWLGAQGYGSYAFVMAWVVILSIPAQFGLPDVLMRDLAVARSDTGNVSFTALLRRTVRLVLIFSLLTAGLGLGASLVLVPRSADDLRLALVIGFCGLPILALLGVYGAAWRGLGRPLGTQIFGALMPTCTVLVLTLGAIVMFGQENNDASTALICRFLGLAAALIAALMFLRRHLARLDRSQTQALPPLRETLNAAMPFMFLTGAFIIMSRTDIVMIGLLATQRDVGLFNAGLQAAILADLGLSISNSIVAPEFARLYANGDKAKLQRLAASTAKMVLIFGLAVLAILALFGHSLLGLMFGTQFQDAFGAMIILVIGRCISLFFGEPGFLLNMTGHQSVTLQLVVGTSLLNIALNAVLIPLAGIEGAALATSIALVTWRILGYRAVRRKLGINCAVFGAPM